MNKQADAFWKLFMETGSVKVYMCYKQMDEQGLSGIEVQPAWHEQALS